MVPIDLAGDRGYRDFPSGSLVRARTRHDSLASRRGSLQVGNSLAEHGETVEVERAVLVWAGYGLEVHEWEAHGSEDVAPLVGKPVDEPAGKLVV